MQTIKDKNILMAEVKRDSDRDKVYLAKTVLERCPDVSCDSVADALRIPRWKVRLLSNGGRTKNKVVDYHPEEIYKLIAQGN